MSGLFLEMKRGGSGEDVSLKLKEDQRRKTRKGGGEINIRKRNTELHKS